MILLEDTRQQAERHNIKHKWFAENGIEIRRTKIYCGDYTLPTNQSICIDSKASIAELCGNVCGKEHARFRRECERAQEAGIQLVILVENKGGLIKGTKIVNPTIRRLEDLHLWVNPRRCIYRSGKQLYPSATRGVSLMKACMTIRSKYGTEFVFCEPEESGKVIIDILEGKKK